jgi:hypothetical protein
VTNFKTTRLSLEKLDDRCMPSAGHMTPDPTLSFTKITMSAEVSISHTVSPFLSVHSIEIAPDTLYVRKQGGGQQDSDEIRVQRVEMA